MAQYPAYQYPPEDDPSLCPTCKVDVTQTTGFHNCSRNIAQARAAQQAQYGQNQPQGQAGYYGPGQTSGPSNPKDQYYKTEKQRMKAQEASRKERAKMEDKTLKAYAKQDEADRRAADEDARRAREEEERQWAQQQCLSESQQHLTTSTSDATYSTDHGYTTAYEDGTTSGNYMGHGQNPGYYGNASGYGEHQYTSGQQPPQEP